jgi:hypothetical protein
VEGRRSRSPLNGLVDNNRMGLFGHSSGGGAAARAAIDIKRTGKGSHLKALAGLGIFTPASRLDVQELEELRDIAVFQLAGQRDSHTSPRSVAISVEAMKHTSPRAVAVIRRGTHCWLDEAASYIYPPSQCDVARRGESFSTGKVLSPEAQNDVTREYLAAFFLAQLGGGTSGVPEAVVREARRRMWGDDCGDMWTDCGASSMQRRVDERLVVELPEEEGVAVRPDVTLSTDPRMSRVEVHR